MKKLIILVCVFSVILVTGCTLFDSPSRESTKIHNQTEVQEPVSYQKNTVEVSSYLSYTSLGLNILCIFCIFLCFSRIKYLKWQIQQKDDRSSKLINRHTQVQSSAAITRLDIENALKGYKLPCSEVNRIVEEVLNRVNVQRAEPQISTPKQHPDNDYTPISSMSIVKKKLYASQWNVENNSFYSVLESPNDNTVYELEVNENSAEFGLYSGAITKIIAAPDFLIHASDVQRMKQYPDRAKTEIKGRAALKNGNWRIETKAKIIFE